MKNDDTEKMLISNTSIEELIKMKIEEEFLSDLEKSKELPKPKIYKDIKDIPKDKVFSKQATYRYFNRNTKCETFINGVQAEALIGLQNNIREKIQNRELSAFTTEDAYVKFEKAEF